MTAGLFCFTGNLKFMKREILHRNFNGLKQLLDRKSKLKDTQLLEYEDILLCPACGSSVFWVRLECSARVNMPYKIEAGTIEFCRTKPIDCESNYYYFQDDNAGVECTQCGHIMSEDSLDFSYSISKKIRNQNS